MADEIDNPWDGARQRMTSSQWSGHFVANGVWALDGLEKWVKPQWCTAMLSLESEGPLWAFDSHLYAYCELLELALAVRLLDGTPGLAKVRKDLEGDHRGAKLYHTRLQLALAARAHRGGGVLRIEPGDPPTDLEATFDSHVLNIEAVSIANSDSSIRARELSDEVSHALTVFGHKRGVLVSGRIRLSAEWATGVCLQQLSAAVEALSDSATSSTVEHEHFDLTVERSEGQVGVGSMSTSFPSENSWSRVRSKLAAKARKAHRSGATWVYADVFNGLFHATPWSQLPPTERATTLLSELRGDEEIRSTLRGVVLSDGAALMRDRPHEASQPVPGLVVAHEALGSLRSRTVYAAALSDDAEGELELWSAMFDHETPWREWAMGECGLPMPEEFQ